MVMLYVGSDFCQCQFVVGYQYLWQFDWQQVFDQQCIGIVCLCVGCEVMVVEMFVVQCYIQVVWVQVVGVIVDCIDGYVVVVDFVIGLVCNQ